MRATTARRGDRPRFSPAAKVILGCAIVLGGLGTLAFVVAGGALLYFLLPGAAMPVSRLPGAETEAVVRVHLDLDDPATAALVQAALTETQARQNEQAQLPPILQSLQAMQSGQNMKELESLSPADLVVVWEPGPEGGHERGILVTLSYFPRGYAMMINKAFDLGSNEGRTTTHRGHSVFVDPEGSAFALSGRSMLFADSLDLMVRLLDRLATDSGEAPSDLVARYLALSEDPAPVRLLASSLVPLEGAAPPPEGCGLVEVRADLLDGDRARVEAFATCESTEATVALRATLAVELLTEAQRFPELDVKLEEELPAGVLVAAEVRGLTAAVRAAMRP